MFVAFYFVSIAVSAFLIGAIEHNTTVGISGAISAVGNIGPAFGKLGALESFAPLHFVTKIILIFDMLFGRLELIPFLVLFQKDIWTLRQ